MKTATPKQRVILDAAIDGSVIRGTLTAHSGARRDFHGWLELNTALEAILDPHADRARNDSPAASAPVPALAREFVICDSWFSSTPGPTFPNRFWVHGASPTTGRWATSPPPGRGAGQPGPGVRS